MGKEDGIETDKFVCPKCGSGAVHRNGNSREVSIYFWVLGILLVITDVVWLRESPLNYWTILVFVLAIISSLMEKSQKPPDGKWELKCERCGEKFLIDEPINEWEKERRKMTEEKIASMEEAIKVYESVNGNEKLRVYKDRFENVLIRNKQEVTVVYRYYNVKSICADKFLKGDRIVIKLVDGNELFFFLGNASTEEYQELATLLVELKDNAPTIEELGISEEEALRELKENKQKSKYELTKKIGKFISEYKNFKELNFFNKVLHIVVPVVCWILLFNTFTGDKGRVIETSVSPTGAVYNLDFEESKEIVEKAIKESCGVKVSLDDDFRLNQDGGNGIQNHIYVANDESVLGFPLGIEIAVVDEYVQSFVFKTDTSSGDFDGLGIIQELYCEVANEVTGDNISLEEIKEIVRNSENNKDHYRNDSIHLICQNRDTFVFYYMFYACSEEFYLERNE